MERELGVPWEDVFASIDPSPLAAGTIGQVHRATLEDGTRVVVKVQRPSAEEEILRDLGLLELFAAQAAKRAGLREVVDVPALVEHLSSSLRRELDFRQEAQNIERMRAILARYDRLAVPGLHADLSTSRLLVMEEVQGGPLRDAPEGPERREAARQLLEAYYRQVLTDGFFHADPHPGNLRWWDGRIYFLDLGMVGRARAGAARAHGRAPARLLAGGPGVPRPRRSSCSAGEHGADLDLDALTRTSRPSSSASAAARSARSELGPMLEGMTRDRDAARGAAAGVARA